VNDKIDPEIQKLKENEIIESERLEKLYYQILTEWIKVKVGKNYTEIPDAWIDENIKDEYKCFGQNWYFKNAQDAAWFMLRWF